MLRGERAPITLSVARRDAAGNPLGQGGVGKEPAGGWGTAAPSEEDIAHATLQADRRWLPTIVQPELCYGWFQKKQGAGLWCRVCCVNVATWSIVADTQEVVMENHRDCPHYNGQVRQSQRDAHRASTS